MQNLFELCRESACGSSSCGASSEGGSDSGTETESESDVSSVDYQSDLFGCWRASRKLSSGNNGQVYLGQLEDDMLDFRVALEIEKRSLCRSHLKNELEVFEAMRCVPGFPRIFDDGRVGSALWCAMELLGPSLRALHDRYTVDEDLTVFVADQMLERLEVTVGGAQTVQFYACGHGNGDPVMYAGVECDGENMFNLKQPQGFLDADRSLTIMNLNFGPAAAERIPDARQIAKANEPAIGAVGVQRLNRWLFPQYSWCLCCRHGKHAALIKCLRTEPTLEGYHSSLPHLSSRDWGTFAGLMWDWLPAVTNDIERLAGLPRGATRPAAGNNASDMGSSTVGGSGDDAKEDSNETQAVTVQEQEAATEWPALRPAASALQPTALPPGEPGRKARGWARARAR